MPLSLTTRLAALFALPAAAQPMANPASFGSGLGGLAGGSLLSGLVFYFFKTNGEEIRWRRGNPALGRAVVAVGAFAGMAIFYVIVFRM